MNIKCFEPNNEKKHYNIAIFKTVNIKNHGR